MTDSADRRDWPSDWSSKEIGEALGVGQPAGSDLVREHYYYLLHALRAEDRILEVGTGPGLFYRFLREHGEYDYTGADLTPEMLSEVKKIDPTVKTVVVDVMDMPALADDSFDWVLCSDVLLHIPRPFDALAELWRVTKGALVVVARTSDYPADLIDLEHSFQEFNGYGYLYNVFNFKGFVSRLQGLQPAPLALSSYRRPMNPTAISGVRIDTERFPVWASSHALLKRDYVKWPGGGNLLFDNGLGARIGRRLRVLRHESAWEM